MNAPHLEKRDSDALSAWVACLKADLGDEIVELRLFGSKARGTASEESDIDVLVVVRSATTEIKNRIVDAAFEVNLAYDVFISPVIYSEEARAHPLWNVTHFGRAVEREGLPL